MNSENPLMDPVYKETYDDIMATIWDAWEKERLTPVLILLYSAIDGFSGLAARGNLSDKDSFLQWVEKWMIGPNQVRPYTPIDLYAARCAVVHNQTANFDVTGKGNARLIYYFIKEARQDVLELTAASLGVNILPLRLEDLISDFDNGKNNCIKAINEDEAWKTEFETKSKMYFRYVKHKNKF